MTQEDITYVLIVDDDEDIRLALRTALEDDGYQVVESPDGVVAWDVLRTFEHPAVVITNHHMPRLDGPGLMSRILEEPSIAARVALIYITAGNRVIAPTLQRQLEELSVRVVRKPFDLDDLLHAVRESATLLRKTGLDAEPEPDGASV